MVNGIVSGSEKFRTKEGRKGVTAVYPNSPRGTEPWVIKLRRNSFHYKACLLFNSMPRWVREVRGGTVERFKVQLNRYLAVVPDRPRDVTGGYYPDPYDPDVQTPSNSLIHWGTYLRELRPWWDW